MVINNPMALHIDQQNIVQMLGIESLPEEQKLAITEQVSTLVEQRMMVRISQSLDGPQYVEFSKLVDSENAEELAEFIAKLNLDISAIMEAEILAVKKDLASWVRSVE